MPDARMLQWPAQARPTIGGGGRISRKVLIRRAAVTVGLLLLLGLAKYVVASREVGPDSLSALPGGRSVTAGLDIGGEPSDYDLQALAESYGVAGVVNLAGPNVAEQATMASLHQSYLRVALPPGAAPTWLQLREVASFLRSHTERGATVYLHDEVGGGRAVVTAEMLLLLRGEPSSAVLQGITTAERESLNKRQMLAIKQLTNALDRNSGSSTGNPYAGARLDRW